VAFCWPPFWFDAFNAHMSWSKLIDFWPKSKIINRYIIKCVTEARAPRAERPLKLN